MIILFYYFLEMLTENRPEYVMLLNTFTAILWYYAI